jgi:hypothetical protein
MSSAVVSTSAAQGRPFVFEVEDGSEACPLPSGTDLNQARPPQRVGLGVPQASFGKEANWVKNQYRRRSCHCPFCHVEAPPIA